ncbi:hypothetical protein OROMI_030334 [Orobanche minor]
MASELNFSGVLVVILLVCWGATAKPEDQSNNDKVNIIGRIGGIIDGRSRVGKEEKIAMEIAADDFRNITGYSLTLQLTDLSGHSARAIFIGGYSVPSMEHPGVQQQHPLLDDRHVDVLVNGSQWFCPWTPNTPTCPSCRRPLLCIRVLHGQNRG